MANGDTFDSTGLNQIFQALLDQANARGGETLAQNAVTDDIVKAIRDVVKDTGKITEKEVDKITKNLLGELRMMFGGNSALTNYVKIMTQLLKDMATSKKGLNETEMANRIIASLSNMFLASRDAKRSGTGQVYLDYESKTAKGSIGAQVLTQTFLRDKMTKIDLTIEKVLDFLNVNKNEEKTKRRQFAEDLVEGLSKSKFIGGAFQDLLRLGALFAGTFLKDKGPIGKALAVALIAGAPIIASAIAGALGRILGTLFSKSLALVANLIFTPIRWLGGRIATWVGQIITAIWTSKAVSTSSSVATSPVLLDQYGKPLQYTKSAPPKTTVVGKNLLRGGLAGMAVGMVSPLVAQGAVSAGVDPRLAHGASGLAQGAVWGATLGSLIPGLGTAVGAGIGAAVGGLAGIITGHYQKQEQIGQEQLGELKKQKSFWSNLKFWGNRDGNGKGVQIAQDGTAYFDGRLVTSGYGMRVHPTKGVVAMHHGIDVDYKEGEEVGAKAAGKVIFAGQQEGYGNVVVVQDSLGAKHTYAHLSEVNKKLLDKQVKKGQIIGKAGSTGDSTGPHLHYETTYEGQSMDPIGFHTAINSLNISDLKNQFKQEYAGSSMPGKKDLPFDEAYKSKEAEEYANKKVMAVIMETAAKSIKVSEATYDDIKDVGASGAEQAEVQWAKINKEFKDEAESNIIQTKNEKPLIDFPGTETCSKVLQNTLNVQQQAFQQR